MSSRRGETVGMRLWQGYVVSERGQIVRFTCLT